MNTVNEITKYYLGYEISKEEVDFYLELDHAIKRGLVVENNHIIERLVEETFVKYIDGKVYPCSLFYDCMQAVLKVSHVDVEKFYE